MLSIPQSPHKIASIFVSGKLPQVIVSIHENYKFFLFQINCHHLVSIKKLLFGASKHWHISAFNGNGGKKKEKRREELLAPLCVKEFFVERNIAINKRTCKGVECKLCIRVCPTNASFWKD
jgi:NAD-dependent dihydropyrimidine dehydrogenase PreA subunit